MQVARTARLLKQQQQHNDNACACANDDYACANDDNDYDSHSSPKDPQQLSLQRPLRRTPSTDSAVSLRSLRSLRLLRLERPLAPLAPLAPLEQELPQCDGGCDSTNDDNDIDDAHEALALARPHSSAAAEPSAVGAHPLPPIDAGCSIFVIRPHQHQQQQLAPQQQLQQQPEPQHTPPAEGAPDFAKAEMAHDPFALVRPASGVWVPLGDDDPWGAANQPANANPNDSSLNGAGRHQSDASSWTPLQTWSASSRSWSLPVRIGPGTSSRRAFPRRPWSRRCCQQALIFAAVGIIVSLATTFIVVFQMHQRAAMDFDASAGPRGSVPGSPPGPPLPVLGVLEYGNPSGRPAIYFGASIDWSIDDPEHFNNDLGHAAAIHDSFFYMNSSSLMTSAMVNSSGTLHTVSDIFAWTAALIRGTGAIMGISVVPIVPLHSVAESALVQLSQKCVQINDLGIPVLLRFAPEMNGNWFPYGQDPVVFRSTFQKLAVMVKNATNNTAMVWSPASGYGYPFVGGQFAPLRNESRIAALDSNKDGRLDGNDDPYAAYYPGDAYVDWVGLSAFYTSVNVSTSFFPLPKEMPFPFPASDAASSRSPSSMPTSAPGPRGPGRGAVSPSPTASPAGLSVPGAQPTSSITASIPAAGPSQLPSAVSASPAGQATEGFGRVVIGAAGSGLGDVSLGLVSGVAIPRYNNTDLPPSTVNEGSPSFEAQLTSAGRPFNFYAQYAQRRRKPLLISETGAAYYPLSDRLSANISELAIKQEWSRQVFSYDLLQRYPLIRAIVVYNKQTPLRATSRWLGGAMAPYVRDPPAPASGSSASAPLPESPSAGPGAAPSASMHVADFALTSNREVLLSFQQDLLPLILAVNVTTNGSNSTSPSANDTAPAAPGSGGNSTSTPLPAPDTGLQTSNFTTTGFLIFANGTAAVLNGTWTVIGARGTASSAGSSATLHNPRFSANGTIIV